MAVKGYDIVRFFSDRVIPLLMLSLLLVLFATIMVGLRQGEDNLLYKSLIKIVSMLSVPFWVAFAR